MKAITVMQPWASAIALGVKDVENRTRGTEHRGPLAIHAGLRQDRAGWRDPNIRVLGLTPATRVPRGHILAVAQLVGAHRTEAGCCTSPWAQPGLLVHLHLSDVVQLPTPVRASGQLGLWKLPADVAALVREQLEAAR